MLQCVIPSASRVVPRHEGSRRRSCGAERRDSSFVGMTPDAFRVVTRGDAGFVAMPRQLTEGLDSRLVDTLPELLDRLLGGGFGAAGVAVVEMGGPLAADVDVFHLVGPVEVLELRHQRVVGLVAAELELTPFAGAPHGVLLDAEEPGVLRRWDIRGIEIVVTGELWVAHPVDTLRLQRGLTHQGVAHLTPLVAGEVEGELPRLVPLLPDDGRDHLRAYHLPLPRA